MWCEKALTSHAFCSKCSIKNGSVAGPALHAKGQAHPASSLLLKLGGGLGGARWGGWGMTHDVLYRSYEAVDLF